MGAKMLQRPADPYLRQQAPEVYGALSGLMGTAPDQQGSVLDPNTARARAGAEIGFPLGTALQMLPFFGPAKTGAMVVGRAGERLAERVVPQIMERGGMGAEMLQGMSRGTVSPLDVYHGTPHIFPPTARNPLGEFDASKIGTGEGAQAYGHGIYTGEAKNTGRRYQMGLTQGLGQEVLYKDKSLNDLYSQIENKAIKLSGKAADIENQKLQLVEHMMLDKSPEELVSYAKETGFDPSVVKWMETDVTPNIKIPGSLYKVDLPDEQIAKMLDWDKPYSEQPPNVQAALKSIVESEYTPKLAQSLNILSKNPLSHSLGTLNDQLGGQHITATYLQQAGIPGIKYLDEGSRGAGKGTRNFVTFPGEEKNLTILERNGQPSALKAEETYAGFATPEQYSAARFQGSMDAERWPAAWQRAGAVTPEEILRGKGIVQPPPTQRDKDLYLLESRFSGYMDASKARQFLENNMLKATKKEKDLLKKYYDASGKFIAREELPVQQQNNLNSFIR
jgi:hypothetical protein